MERISVTTATRNFSEILNQVILKGAIFELERDNKIIARLSPTKPSSPLTVKDLNRFFAQLPPLDDDASSFAQDVNTIRQEIPKESILWD